jgi:hypothetical protein
MVLPDGARSDNFAFGAVLACLQSNKRGALSDRVIFGKGHL